MENFFDNIVKHNCQKIFPPDCTEVFIVEKPHRGRNFARFSPLAFAAQNFRGRSSRSPLARPLRKKDATPIGLRFFQVAGWASRRIGLRCACPVGFLRCKNPVRLSPARSAKKRNPYRIAFFSSGGMDETRTRDLLRDRQKTTYLI